MFLGKTRQRTMFHIEVQSGADISRFSGLPESEVILLPGTRLGVRAVLDLGHEVHIVQMEEQPTPGLLDLYPPSVFRQPLSHSEEQSTTPDQSGRAGAILVRCTACASCFGFSDVAACNPSYFALVKAMMSSSQSQAFRFENWATTTKNTPGAHCL